MRLQEPLKQNLDELDDQFQQTATIFKWLAIYRVFLISDPGNTQETQEFCWKETYKA